MWKEMWDQGGSTDGHIICIYLLISRDTYLHVEMYALAEIDNIGKYAEKQRDI